MSSVVLMKRAFDEKSPTSGDVPSQAAPAQERLQTDHTLDKHFGSYRLVERFIGSWLKPHSTSRILLLSGTSDLAEFIASCCKAGRIAAHIDAVESSSGLSDQARTGSSANPHIHWIYGNPLTFESPATYDLVYCALTAHRWTEDETVILLRKARTQSHRFALVSDLERGVVTNVGVTLLTRLVVRGAAAREYGRRCIQEAYSWNELRDLGKRAGWESFYQGRFLLCCQAIWLAKHDPAEIRQIAAPVPSALPCPT